MATIQQHDQRKLVHKQFNSPMGLYSDQNVKETLDREIKAFGGAGIELDNQYLGKPSNLQNSAVLKMLEEEESERYTAKRIAMTTQERQSRSRNRCIIDRDTVLKINRRPPKRDYSWPPPELIYSRSRSSSDEQFNEDIRHKHKIDHIKEMFDKGIIFQHKNLSTINKINCIKNSESLINLNQIKYNNTNNKSNNIRSRSLNDNFRGNNNAKYNNELLTNNNLIQTNLKIDDNLNNDCSESIVGKKHFYLPENEFYIGMVEPTRKYFENLSNKNSIIYPSPTTTTTTTNQLSLSSDTLLCHEKKWKSTENFHQYCNNNNTETRTKYDSLQQQQNILNSSSTLKSDNNNFLKEKYIFTPAIKQDTNKTNTNTLRTLSLDRQQQNSKKKYNSNSFNELPPLKPRGEYRKNLPSNNKTKLNLNNIQNNNVMEIMENSILNKTTKTNENFHKKFIQNLEKSSEICNTGKEIETNLNYIELNENLENFRNSNLTSTCNTLSNNNNNNNTNKKNAIKLKISSNNNNCDNENSIIISNDDITKFHNKNCYIKSLPVQSNTKNIIKSNNRNQISYSIEPQTTIEKTLLNFHEKCLPSDNITSNISNTSSSNSSSSSRNSNNSNKKNTNQNDENKTIKFSTTKKNHNIAMQKKNGKEVEKENIIICNISDADESTKCKKNITIQNENINNKNDNKIQDIRKNYICIPKITKIPTSTSPSSSSSSVAAIPTIITASAIENVESKTSDGQKNEIFCRPLVNINNTVDYDDGLGPNQITNFSSSNNKIILQQQGSNNKKNFNLYDDNDKNSKIKPTTIVDNNCKVEYNNTENNCNNNNSMSSTSSLVRNDTIQIKQYENQIITSNTTAPSDDNCNNNKYVKQNLILNSTSNNSPIINLNENLKKNYYIPDNTELIITSDGKNRIVNIINLNENKDLENSNSNKLYNQSTKKTTSLSSLLTSPMYSKDLRNNDKQSDWEIKKFLKKKNKNLIVDDDDSITQDDNKNKKIFYKNNIENIENENDENLVNTFLNEQENITLVVKKNIYQNENNDIDDIKKYSCLETKNIDNIKPTDKDINFLTTNTNNNDNSKVKMLKQITTTNTIKDIPKIIKKMYNKPINDCLPTSDINEKRNCIYYTDDIEKDIWQENNKILSYDPKTIINENNVYKQVHLIDDKLNDLLQIKENENNNIEKLTENENKFKMKIQLNNQKINDNDDDSDKTIIDNLILIENNNINLKKDIYNNYQLNKHENKLIEIPSSTTATTTDSLCGKYTNMQKSISEDLKRIDRYMESAEKSLYNINTKNLFQSDINDNIFIFESPLKKIMKHFQFCNRYKPIQKNFNDNEKFNSYNKNSLLIKQTENMPVVENVLIDLYNISLLLDNSNKTLTNHNDYENNNENMNNKTNIIEINDYDIEDQSKDDTNSIFSSNTTCTETLSTTSEPTTIDKIIQSKNILSGYLITKQNQDELFDKTKSILNQLQHENPLLIDYNNRNYLDYNENVQHHHDQHNLNNNDIKSILPSSYLIKTNTQDEKQEKFLKKQQKTNENFNNDENKVIQWKENLNDDKKNIISNSSSTSNENNILKTDFKMSEKQEEENIMVTDKVGHKNHYKILSNKIADNVKFKIDKSRNFEYYDAIDDVVNVNKQIHQNQQHIHDGNYQQNNEYPILTTTDTAAIQNINDDVINGDTNIIDYSSEKTMKRSSPKIKVEKYIVNDDDVNNEETDNNNVSDNNKSDKYDDTNSNASCIEIIPKNLILTKSNQIELSSVVTAENVKTIKLVETNELTPSPTLSTYDNNNDNNMYDEKCVNTNNNEMSRTMMSEINFNKQQKQQIHYNHETKYRNYIDNDDGVILNSDNDVDNNMDLSYQQNSGENIKITTTGINNKNNCGIMNNLLKDVVDNDGQCGIMKNSINGEYNRNNDGYINRNTNKNTISDYYYLTNSSEPYNKSSNQNEIYFIDSNTKNTKYFNNNDDDDDDDNQGIFTSSKNQLIDRERSRSHVRFIDTINNDDYDNKPKYHLRCTSQPPPIKHLIKISKDYINFNSENYYNNLMRQHSYDSNINNCDNYQYLMSSPTLQLYPLDGQYEWTNEGYKRVAWPPADQARTYRAYTPTPQPTNQQPNQDNNSYQSQPTQSQYPQQPYSGGQSYDPHHQQQHHQPQQQQPQHHQPQQYQQPSQNPSYQPVNQGYQKPSYPGANQPSSQPQGNQPQQSRPQQGYQPAQSHPQQGYQPQQPHPQQGYQPQEGHQPQQSHPQQGHQPPQGHMPQQSHHPQQGHMPQQPHPQQGYQPQKSQPEQGYVHPLNQQPSSQQGYVHPQPHSPQPQQQPTSNPYQQSGYVPYPHQDNNYPSSHPTGSAPSSHMNGPGSTVSFTGGVAQRPTQTSGLPQYNPQPKPFQSQYNVPPPSVQSYQQQHQPVQTGDEQHRGWTHVASPAPVRSGYPQSGYQPNMTGGVLAAPQYGSDSQFGSNQNISNQQQPTNQAYNQSVPVSHNQPAFGQQQQSYQKPQQQNQMHPAQNQYHQQPSSFESQNNQYNQQQPQQQYNSQAEQPPGVITLRRETPTHQGPAPVIVSQPATKSFRGGSIMRGDLKWPPQDCRERMAADAELEHQLSLGPACRPTKQQKDYSGFFAKHALSHNYPGYKIPPGTQHIEATY